MVGFIYVWRGVVGTTKGFIYHIVHKIFNTRTRATISKLLLHL